MFKSRNKSDGGNVEEKTERLYRSPCRTTLCRRKSPVLSHSVFTLKSKV